jgi:hypothetical protein
VAIIFMLAILLHFSTVLTRLTQQNRELAQQMAILRWELTETRRGSGEAAGGNQDQHQGDSVEG